MISFVACDVVPEDDRLIDMPLNPSDRTVLLIEFTGCRCVNCPGAAMVANEMLFDKVYRQTVQQIKETYVAENEIKEIEDVMDAINKALKDAVKDGGFTYVKEQDYLTLFEKIPSEYQTVFGKMYGEIKSAIGKGAKDIDAQLAYTNDILKKRIRESNSYVENFNEILKKSLDKNVFICINSLIIN